MGGSVAKENRAASDSGAVATRLTCLRIPMKAATDSG